jgi:hypothetical protein
LPDEQQTDDILYRALTDASWVVDILSKILKTGDQLFNKGSLSETEWPPDVVRELASLEEGFEDLQETLALGVSAEFRQELEAAKIALDTNEDRS